MKKILSLVLALVVVCIFSIFALGSGESENDNQGDGKAEISSTDTNLGDYKVVIDSFRLAKDYEGKAVVIVKFIFTNNAENATAFFTAFDDKVYQNGVGLNESYVLADNANYSSDNQTKEIKKDATLDVEVAYELNDTTTDIEVEVEELFGFNDSKVTKKFSIK